jgi:hypothetical protein
MGIVNLESTIRNLKSRTFFPALEFAAVLLLAGWIWMEHNAHLRSERALKEIQRQAGAEVLALRAQADSASRAANQNNARASSELEASRRLLQQKSHALSRKLADLAAQEKTRLQNVVALPAPEVRRRLEAQLGGGAFEHREPGAGESESRNQNGPNSGAKGNLSSPTQNPSSDSCSLTDAGARRVETALVELDSCREKLVVQSAQSDNCQKVAAAEAAMVEQQKSSIAQLNLALGDKDQILAKRETELKAEIKAARGNFLTRAKRATEWVAVGVAVGLALR